MRLGFIGGGVMAEAIIAGMKDAGLAADVSVGDPVRARRETLAKYGAHAAEDNSAVVRGADIVVLAVKPQQFDQAAASLKGVITERQTVVSIMAGVKMSSLALKLGHTRLARVMPNTPAQVRKGMCAWVVSQDTPAEHAEFLQRMLRAVGEEQRFYDEKQLDIATALSASGPAYVFMFIEAMSDAAVMLGMAPDAARRLAVETVLGSGALAKATGKHPAELRNSVTSPGGTTAAGLLALEDGGFRATVIKAVRAAHERGEQLGAVSK
jgi:pyrroline-5-carboxylate reductase